MNTKQVALYARVSSEQQAEAKTIESQLAEVRAQIAADGFDVQAVLEFVDEGYSGSTLVRPALERLRDVAASGSIDRLYVHCPDRFARNYAYQVLLLDELTQQGVEVIFLNRPLGQTAEDQLLLQVQGVIAEYERAKFLERSHRGKRHAAQEGRVGILCHAPYGYRYVNKQEGGGEARFEMVFDEARVVRQVFAWVGEKRHPTTTTTNPSRCETFSISQMGGRRAGRRRVYSILNWVPWQAGSDACAGEASGLHSGVQIGSTGALDGFR